MTQATASPTFGRWLKRLRAQHDITQEQLAELAFCSVQAIRFFESGKRRPSVETAERLAELLSVPEDQRATFIRQARMLTDTAAENEAAPVASAPPPPAPTPRAAATRLPAATTALIGRQAERAVVHQLLREQRRLISLIGPGGIGKTRLALAIAHELAAEHPYGVAVVALASLTRADEIPAAIAEALGVPLPGASDMVSQVTAVLAGRNLLLVLDNFEHLLLPERAVAATTLIEQILQYTQDVRILITSRERLRLHGEHCFELSGLAVPSATALVAQREDVPTSDAVQLFLRRASQAQRDFAMTAANQATIVRICTLLEGIPLGIELAAAWVRLLTVEEIAAEIARNLDFLTLSTRDAPARHRSLRAVFDHSWTLLSDDERTVLARLAIFRNGFSRAAASEVASANLSILAALIDKSLVRATPTSEGGVRYDMHELLGQYLRDKLQATGEAQTLMRRHAEFFAALAERLEPMFYATDASASQRQLEQEQGNVRAALQWSLGEGQDGAIGLRLAGAMGRFWYLSGRWAEGRNWLQLAQQQAVDGGAARARMLVSLGELQYLLGDHAHAQANLEEGLARWRALQEPSSIAWALFQVGNLHAMRGNYAVAETYFDESLTHYRTLNNRWGLATVLNQLGSVAINLGDYKRAVTLLDESLPIVRSLQRLGGVAVSLNVLGRAVLGEGDQARAIALFQEALEILRQRKNKAGMAWSLINLGLAEVQAQRPNVAVHHFFGALRLYEELESKGGLMATFEGLAAVAVVVQAFERAANFLAVAEDLRTESGQVLTLFEQEMHDRTRQACEAALTPAAWRQAWTSGKHLSLPQVIRLAESLAASLDDSPPN